MQIGNFACRKVKTQPFGLVFARNQWMAPFPFASDNEDPRCSFSCVQEIEWLGTLDVDVVYDYADLIDSDPDEFSYTMIARNPETVVIATVPEPTSTALCLTAVLFGAGMGRWRKRKR